MSITVAFVKFSSTSTTLLEPFRSSSFSSYFSLETRRGRNTQRFNASDQRIASLIMYPGDAAPSSFLTKLNSSDQSSRRNSPRSLSTAIHRLLVFATLPSGRVYSLPMLPMYSSLFFTVAHSHFIPLSVSPSPSVMTKRGATYESFPPSFDSTSNTVPVLSSNVKRRFWYNVNSLSSIPRPASLCCEVRIRSCSNSIAYFPVDGSRESLPGRRNDWKTGFFDSVTRDSWSKSVTAANRNECSSIIEPSVWKYPAWAAPPKCSNGVLFGAFALKLGEYLYSTELV
mmetsp:Transcript_10414/g.15390  ORF Transcript_10414/g.15390 Transcript_10414/m.15390 type:complete len:284 (-) Transcript_10414:526-1377(-)